MNRTLKATAVLMLMMVFAVGCTKPNEPNNGGNNNGQNDSIADNSGTLNGHDFVDLGLPSGTLWATCNVGADSIGDYGDRFAWGETSPKEAYNWQTYKYTNDDKWVLKYCVNNWNTHNGEYGFEDLLTELEAIDDAATVNWGDGWRTPTVDDWRELRDNCFHDTIVLNNVRGHLIKSPNGNSIFLPVEEIYPVFAYYWSSTLNTDYGPYYAFIYRFKFFDNDHGMSATERYRGCAVRPVCSVK